MNVWRLALPVVASVLLSACGGSSWVHPNKPQDAFAEDYNRCETDVIKDPKLQQGNKYLVLQATERCVMKKGWRIKDQDE
jgi:outer membrane biogenesis lipoprotein LolB